jgi:hypothetical protein
LARPTDLSLSEPPFTLERRVGRLIEARVFRLRSRAEADVYCRALGVEVAKVPLDLRPVLCADHRPVVVYPQDAADRLTELFCNMNTRLSRIAILVAPTNATLTLQLNRIVREARYENRRVFHDAAQALTHMTPSLDEREIERARAFLAGFQPARR